MIDFLVTHGSYLLIFAVLVLSGIGLPIPEEVPIVAAGIMSLNDKMEPWPAFAVCLAGALLGDCVMYYVGCHFGRGILSEHPWWARLVTPARERQIERLFKKHGLKVFFVARFLVGLRSPVYVTAGILRVPFGRFLLIDSFCATSVVGTFFYLTYQWGRRIAMLFKQIEVYLTVVIICALIGISIYVWRRYLRKYASSEALLAAAAEADCDDESTEEKNVASTTNEGDAALQDPMSDVQHETPKENNAGSDAA